MYKLLLILLFAYSFAVSTDDISKVFEAKGNNYWWIQTFNQTFENYHIVKMEGDILFINDKDGNAEEISITNIQFIASKPELTLDQCIIWVGLGAYGGAAVGYFIGWPLFPAWGSDEADLRGIHKMAVIGAVVGAVWTYKWRQNNKLVSRTKAMMTSWPIHRKKDWIRSNVLKL